MSDPSFTERYGPWALVAGGSEGIGAAFARAAAQRGCHVAIVANTAGPLEATAAELRGEGHEVRSILADLATVDGIARVTDGVADLDVGLVVWVAADPAIGDFLDVDVDRLLGAVDLNVTGPVRLVRALAPAMAARGHGGVVLLSSLSAIHGSARLATYAATKSFTRTLAEGLWAEFAEHGVDVVAAMPGATDTPAYRRSGATTTSGLGDPAEVATATLDRLGRGPTVVPGTANRASALLLQRLLPNRTAVRLFSRVARRLYRTPAP